MQALTSISEIVEQVCTNFWNRKYNKEMEMRKWTGNGR